MQLSPLMHAIWVVWHTISYHSELSLKSCNSITKKYITKIASCHDTLCVFKIEAESLFLSLSSSSANKKEEKEKEEDNADDDDGRAFPSYLHNVLNDDYLVWKNLKNWFYIMRIRTVSHCKNIVSFPIAISITAGDNIDDFLSA